MMVLKNGFKYHLLRENCKSSYFECRDEGCTALLTLDSHNQLLRSKETHNHQPKDEVDIEIEAAVNKILKRFESEEKAIRDIYEDELIELSNKFDKDLVLTRFPEFSSVKTRAYQRRWKNVPKLPASVKEVELEGEHASTISGKFN